MYLATVASTGLILLVAPAAGAAADSQGRSAHPRLYMTAMDLPRLRAARNEGVHARIWANLKESADWCARQTPRTEWIPTLEPDPMFENLYDRFYGAMHDMAILEHLAFASILSDPADDPYFEAARRWTLATAKIWKQEASNKADQSKAYAVLRIVKALAVAYDLLYERLSESERAQCRATLTDVAREYFAFFADPVAAGEGYNKHHGNVDVTSFGVVALSVLDEVPEARAWLDRAIQKHVDYLLPHGLTPSGTNAQSSNFWASTLQYRIFFLDALRRATGRDLCEEFPDALPGRIALAAVAGEQPAHLRYNESHRSVLFAPSYGQFNYWSPVLLFLAHEQQRPIYQHLALWDQSLGSLQRTRYVTPTRKEELLFSFGGYCYVWYDPAVPDAIEADLPRAFAFPEPEVNEAYLRDSYLPEGIVVGMQKGALIIHAGGRPVYVDLETNDANNPAKPVDEQLVADDGRLAKIRCVGPASQGVGQQLVELLRPGKLHVRRECSQPLKWWYGGEAQRDGNSLAWPDGTKLTVTRGRLAEIDPRGYTETKVHYGGMRFADPHPFVYPVVTLAPEGGVVEWTVAVSRQ
ncbi:MAG TPA: DUF4962 domain-containing protein [Pirellulales bacterium]|nr:DUF4962 domain-containing protein [Pirellulales bacterium]